MSTRTPFRILLQMFQDRFFEDDTVSPGSGFQTNIYQVLGFLVTVGFFVAYLSMPIFAEISVPVSHSPAAQWVLRGLRLFGPALSFAVIGFTTVFQWDMLFPDRRDFLILTLFPVPLRQIFLAKFAALGRFLFMLIAALNFFPFLSAFLFSFEIASTLEYKLRLIATEIVATVCGAVCAFLLIAAFQGILINVTSPRLFRRLSPWIQMSGMSLMVLSIATFPFYFYLLKHSVETRQPWLWLFPPVWFTGLYDLILPSADPFFVSMGHYGLAVLALLFLCFCLTWALGYKRHFRRMLEAEDTQSRRPARNWARPLTASPQEWSMLDFCRKTLARSTKHRLFLATWASIAVSAGLFVGAAVRNGKVELSPGGARAFPFLMVFFAVSGFRTVFQFPADLACNWQLQIAESRWAETARRAARKAVLLYGIVPLLVIFLPFEISDLGIATGSLHFAYQLVSGALLLELMFWTFGKVPFTCSYFAGKVNLVLLAVFYLYGFTTYSFNMADLEKAMESRIVLPALFFPASVFALALLWRRTPAASEVIFDATEPVIQTLDLN